MTEMQRLPTIFVSHGAPTFVLEPGIAGPALRALGRALPRPAAVLVVSAHWLAPQVQVSLAAQPATIHDFSGFERSLYDLRYPAAGHPALAQQTLDVLRAAGWSAAPNATRGLDHGAWVPLTFLYPDADVPVFQVSMPMRFDAAGAWSLGEALRPLADQGVLIVGSGSLTHNLHEAVMGASDTPPYVHEFIAWVQEAVVRGDRTQLRQSLALAPHAARAHPTAEHFWPLLVAAGAAREILPATLIQGGVEHRVVSMDSYVFGGSLPV